MLELEEDIEELFDWFDLDGRFIDDCNFGDGL